MGLFSTVTLYEDPRHRFLHLGWEEQEEEGFVQTNQYLIQDGDEVVLLDPGGAHVFPRVLANVAEVVDLAQVRHIFYSHQDPDVSSGVTLWLPIAERAKVYISGLWTRFLPHFEVYDQRRIVPIPDGGAPCPWPRGTSFSSSRATSSTPRAASPCSTRSPRSCSPETSERRCSPRGSATGK